MRGLLILALCLLLSSCHTPPARPPPLPPPSEEAFQEAEHELFDCLQQKIPVLDDAVSEARTVAAAVVSACARQFHRAAEVYGRRLSPDAQRLYRAQVQSSYIEIALAAVLDYRRSPREPL
jgi:hypothetical protein